jgi:positive regulator of sigma E activity
MTGAAVERSGEVVGISDGFLQLSVSRSSGCSACRQKAGCAQGVFARPYTVAIPAEKGQLLCAVPGTQVSLKFPGRLLSRLIILAYLLMPVLMLLGAWLAEQLAGGDLAVLCGAIIGGGVGCLVLRLYHSCGLAAGSLRSLSVRPRTGADNV